MKKIFIILLSLFVFHFKSFATEKIRIIIGNGTSAQVYRSTVPIENWKTIIIGGMGLWEEFKEHPMGQTAQILHLPEQKIPPFIEPNGTKNLSEFHSSGTYQKNLRELSLENGKRDQAQELPDFLVREISRHGSKIFVKATRTDGATYAVLADQVILTTGIPPQRNLNHLIKNSEKAHDNLGYVQIQEGIDYLSQNSKYDTNKQLEVALYGGSATAAWAAEVIDSRNPIKFHWFARPGSPGEDKFKEANVAGARNHIILQKTIQNRTLETLESITYLSKGEIVDGNLLTQPKLKIDFNTNGVPRSILVDQLVYALGGDPDGDGSIKSIISEELQNEIRLIPDSNYVFGDVTATLPTNKKPGLGWRTPDGQVQIVGTAAYNYKAPNGDLISPPMKTLPTNGQVPFGIAVASSTISALNNYIPIKQDLNGKVYYFKVNINTADRNQLSVYIALIYPYLMPKYANEAVEEVIRSRSDGNISAFGISPKRFDEIIEQAWFKQSQAEIN